MHHAIENISKNEKTRTNNNVDQRGRSAWGHACFAAGCDDDDDGDGDDDDDGGDDDDDDDDYGGEDDVNVSYEHWLWDLEYAGGLANKILNRIAACINIDGQQWKWKSFST